MPSRLPLAFAGVVLCTSLLPAALAAKLTVTVVDAAGKPLEDAVLLLQPASGKAAVKPLASADISQDKRTFTPRVTVVPVGTPVSFPNFDTVRHHVYSFSPAKTFELKLYSGVPTKPVVFDKPGVAVLGCNIHDQMAAWVVVADTPWYGRSGANGQVVIDGAPAGSYQLYSWHPALAANTGMPVQPLTLGAADSSQRVMLKLSAGF